MINHSSKLLKNQFLTLLDSSMLENDCIEPTYKESNLTTTIQNVCLMLKSTGKLKGINISQKINKNLNQKLSVDDQRIQ